MICILALTVRVLSAHAAGATLFLSPATGSYSAGTRFTVSIRLNSGGASINAAEATLAFNPEELEVVSLSKTGSIFSLWTQEPVFSQNAGSMSFGGGVPSPGFNGTSGLVFTATLKVKKSGTATMLRFTSGSVLANDGSGTNILSASQSATFTAPTPAPKQTPAPTPTPMPSPLSPPSLPAVSSPTHPVNTIGLTGEVPWIANNDPEFDWKSDPDANSFSYMLDHDASATPDTGSEGSLTVKTYSDLTDGIWYFHVRAQNAGGWSEASHYGIQLDATPPEAFGVEVVEGRDITDPTPHIRFGTKDVSSGIDYYAVRVGSGETRRVSPTDTANPIELGPFSPGTFAIEVVAYDRAQNSRAAYAEFTMHALVAPTITAYEKTLSTDEVVFLEGKSPPHTIVVITIERPDGTDSSTREVVSDADGNWTFLGKRFRDSGKWRVLAQTKDTDGALSDKKAEIAVEVLSTAVQVGPYRITYASAYGTLGGLLMLLFLVVLGFFFAFRRKLRRFRQDVLKEVTEAEEAVRLGFQTLRGDIIEELHTMDALQALRALTTEENARREKLLKDLAFIEFRVTKEVGDIERVILPEAHGGEQVPQAPAPTSPET